MALMLLHAAAILAMMGLIWFVQIVHYPLFELASESGFERFAAQHQRRTSYVVVPLMITEAVTALTLLVASPPGLERALLWLGLLLLAVIWLSTGLFQIPLHRRLANGRDAAAIGRLVTSNWLRTVAWTARSGLALYLLAEAWR